MTNRELENQKKELVEKLGVQLEHQHQMSPVAARIFTTLILTGREGITFEDLVQDLNASKSTVSTNLENLQIAGRVSYFTKPGDRKRYFVINPDLMINYIEETVAKWKTEKEIHLDIINYKKKHNELKNAGEPKFDLDFNKDFLTYLEEATAAIEKLKSNILSKKDNIDS